MVNRPKQRKNVLTSVLLYSSIVLLYTMMTSFSLHSRFFFFSPLAFFVCGGERVASIKITVHAGQRGSS